MITKLFSAIPFPSNRLDDTPKLLPKTSNNDRQTTSRGLNTGNLSLTDGAAVREGLNTAAYKRFTLQNRLSGSVLDTPTFQGIGGDWRKKPNGEMRFYRTGEDIGNTTVVDQEFFQDVDSKWIRLNARGALRDLPQNKDKWKPAEVSDFDWNGWEQVEVSRVPADYTTEGKNISFADQANAENPRLVTRRYLQQQVIGADKWTETGGLEAVRQAEQAGIKIGLEKVGEKDGQTIYQPSISAEDLRKLQKIKSAYLDKLATEIQAGKRGQAEADAMATDGGKVYPRAVINSVEDSVNLPIAILNGSTQTDPHNWTRAKIGDIADAQLPPSRNGQPNNQVPYVDLSDIKPEYQSDLFNRDVRTGKVDREGVTVGKLTETAVEMFAPTQMPKVNNSVRSTIDDMVYHPKTTGLATIPRGSGITTKYGDIVYSTRGTIADQKLALYHERVHQALTPKLLAFRELRLNLKWTAYNKSQFCRYLEEALAETVAQMKVNGIKGLPDAIRFPLKNEGYNIQLSKVITEGAIGTISLGGVSYGVYVIADATLNSNDGR